MNTFSFYSVVNDNCCHHGLKEGKVCRRIGEAYRAEHEKEYVYEMEKQINEMGMSVNGGYDMGQSGLNRLRGQGGSERIACLRDCGVNCVRNPDH